MLEDNIRAKRRDKGLLLMPHLVLGYPSFEDNRAIIKTMVESGADIIEMQIPFSEPMSDGPVILHANDAALKNGTTTTKCLDFAKQVCAENPSTIFVFMTYFNILFAYGVERFVEKAKSIGVQGLIVPDLPPEEGTDYQAACDKFGVAPIYIFTPTNTIERLKKIAGHAKGMIYGVGRKGVTGIKTQVDETLNALVKKYRSVTQLPIALGFGIQSKDDVAALGEDVDIAVIGTKLLVLQQERGVAAVGEFLRSLRGERK